MSLPFPHACVERIDHPTIKLGGQRTSTFYLLNPQRRTAHRGQLDGCLHEASTLCDWLVETADDLTPQNYVFVELKGHDYGHAIAQLEAALRVYLRRGRELETRCYIVGTGFPSFRTQGQKAADRFQRLFNVKLETKRDRDSMPL